MAGHGGLMYCTGCGQPVQDCDGACIRPYDPPRYCAECGIHMVQDKAVRVKGPRPVLGFVVFAWHVPVTVGVKT